MRTNRALSRPAEPKPPCQCGHGEMIHAWAGNAKAAAAKRQRCCARTDGARCECSTYTPGGAR